MFFTALWVLSAVKRIDMAWKKLLNAKKWKSSPIAQTNLNVSNFLCFLHLKVEVCSGSLVDVLQAVVGGSEGCLFSYGHAGLGKFSCFSASDFVFIPRVLHVLFSTFYKCCPMQRRHKTRYEHVTKCLPGTKHMLHPKQTLPPTTLFDTRTKWLESPYTAVLDMYSFFFHSRRFFNFFFITTF